MKTIAIISQKGGAGKTTLAIHIAASACNNGYVSLILDTDPQATASSWSEWRNGAEPEVVDCASPPLLGKKLKQAEELGANLVIIDTPPHAEAMAREACKFADLILIPCRPRAFDMDAIGITADLAKSTDKLAFVIFTAGQINAPAIYKEAREAIDEGYNIPVAPVILPERAIFHHATGKGQSAQEAEPNGKAAIEVSMLWAWVSEQVGLLTSNHVNKSSR